MNLDEELNIYWYKIKRFQDDLISRCSVEDNQKICDYMKERFKTVYNMEF